MVVGGGFPQENEGKGRGGGGPVIFRDFLNLLSSIILKFGAYTPCIHERPQLTFI